MPNRLPDLERRLEGAVRRHWTYRLDQLGRASELPFWRVRVPPRGRLHTRVCLAAGIHGDEPAGLEAVLRLIETGSFPHGVAVDCFPCMNPAGWMAGTRGDGVVDDLNRTFDVDSPPAPVTWFRSAVESQPYDLYIDLHEDSRAEGFYLFELERGEAPLGPAIAQAVAQSGRPLAAPDHLKHLIEDDGFEQAYGPFRLEPGLALPGLTALPAGGLPQAAYMALCRNVHALTLETPAGEPLETRVAMHQVGVSAIFDRLKARSRFAAFNPAREWVASEPPRRR